MLLFRKIVNGLSKVNSQLSNGFNSSQEDEAYLRQKQAIVEVQKFVWDCSWLRGKKSLQQVRAFLRNGLDYDQTAKQLNMKRSTLEVAISKANKTLEGIIGEDVIDLILAGQEQAALNQFNVAVSEYKHLDLVMHEVVGYMPEKGLYPSITAADCVQELTFLRYFTSTNIRSLVQGLDQTKLSLLRYILETEDGAYTQERQVIGKYLAGELGSVEDTSHLSAVLEALRTS